mmetsp:Transcript_22454/g.39478  ORF Transcript_22454/g.39478 Transcript_22454/m.39478 type:complete len:203 (-) Transcript_22454:230-838(-)
MSHNSQEIVKVQGAIPTLIRLVQQLNHLRSPCRVLGKHRKLFLHEAHCLRTTNRPTAIRIVAIELTPQIFDLIFRETAVLSELCTLLLSTTQCCLTETIEINLISCNSFPLEKFFQASSAVCAADAPQSFDCLLHANALPKMINSELQTALCLRRRDHSVGTFQSFQLPHRIHPQSLVKRHFEKVRVLLVHHSDHFSKLPHV